VDGVLDALAALAVAAVPGADGVVLGLVHDARPGPWVATSELACSIAEIEEALAEGPGLLAVQAARPQVTGSLGGDLRWPRFGPRAGRLGVHSALAIPLTHRECVVGALGLYARRRDGFGAEPGPLLAAVGVAAAAAIATAGIVEQSTQLAERLERAITSRAVIDQAIGILVSRSGVTPAEAFDRLRAMSQETDVKLAEIARRLVEQSRARARRRLAGAQVAGRSGNPPGSARPS
jgi:hypothetical protein